MLISSPWRNQKPQYGTPINRRHPLAQGLVACWLYNEGAGGTVFDATGCGHHGVLHGTAGWTMGQWGKCLTGGTTISDYVDYGISSSGLGLTSIGTVCGWINCTISPTTNGSTVLSDWVSNVGLTLRIDNAGETFYVYPNNSRATSSFSATVGAWYHLAGVMTGSQIVLYLNGNPVSTVALANGVGASSGTLKTFNRGDLASPTLCAVDVPMLYNRPLSGSEVQQLYSDPFCFMQPRRVWVPEASGAAPATTLFRRTLYSRSGSRGAA